MGPLEGLTIIEIAGIGPGPFGAMLLSDMGADVLRLERHHRALGGDPDDPPKDVLNRGRRSMGVDLKNPEGVETVLRLVEKADGLIEGFRPGVMENLGLGPDDCLARNPRLVYGRMTGWGQDGPLAHAAGHDINYISLGGVLANLKRPDSKPLPPMNLVGDFGGGGMFLAFGMVCGILEAQRSGEGQVVDAAMLDGATTLQMMMWGMKAMGMWREPPGTNLLDTGAHFYEVYECADGKFVGVGSIEPKFYQEMVEGIGLAVDDLPSQMNWTEWPEAKEKLAEIFKQKTRDEWAAIFDGTDACVSPILDMNEAPEHPHNKARGTFVDHAGVVQPAPAPRFSRTQPEIQRPTAHCGQHTDEILADYGFSDAEIEKLRGAEAVR